MKILLIIIFVFYKTLNYNYEDSKDAGTMSENGNLNFTQLVTKYGHNAEQYTIITEDGYILTLFHIPGERTPVLLTHGLFTDGDCWVVRGNGSLGIGLADSGYDVWIINNRGTKFSRRHEYLDPDSATDKRFWDFSFHEMGYYDLAAAIDFVCSQTGQKIVSVAVSQGATQHFALMSLRPEYNKKVKLFVALAPAAYFYNMPASWFTLISDAGPVIRTIVESLGIEELFEEHGILQNLFRMLCTNGVVSYTLCVKGILFPLMGSNPAGFEIDFLPIFFGHAPAGISRKSLVHYNHLYLSKKFINFDYGPENWDRYGQAEPPEYELSKAIVDVALIPGTLDTLVTAENVKVFEKNLPNAVYFEELANMSHIDFLFGKEASKHLFPSIFRLLEKYELYDDY